MSENLSEREQEILFEREKFREAVVNDMEWFNYWMDFLEMHDVELRYEDEENREHVRELIRKKHDDFYN